MGRKTCPAGTGASGAVSYHSLRLPTGAAATRPTRRNRTREEDVARVTDPIPGRSLVTRRAIRDIVRTAVLASYGVTGFAGGGPRPTPRPARPRAPGPPVRVGDGVAVELDLTVAYGVPIAEVARQVDSAVRYALRHALGREADRVIHIGGLRSACRHPARRGTAPDDPGPSDLADSGTDVA